MKRLYLLAGFLALAALACGGDGGTGSQATAPAATAAAASTPAASGGAFSVDDPAGDCLSNQNVPIACLPAALDMRRFTVERNAAGDIVVTVEISGGGVPALGDFTLLVAFDTDRNATTGNNGYAPSHGLAPEVELAYRVRSGVVDSQVRLYTGPAPALGDATLVQWRQVDPARLQATVHASLLNTTSFWVVTDLSLPDRYDHIPDNARVSYPEGRLLPR